jgi:DNA-binding HxlR family transcriptional regulator
MNLNAIDNFFKSKFDKKVSAGSMAVMAGRKSYNQNCPVAKGLDILGERWTLLILRELFGGPRRYSDLRAELPGIATNLLAERLKELQDAGLVDRAELPPPVARTVYSLSDVGWQRVPCVLQSIAWLGLDRVDLIGGGSLTSLTGFLAGFVVAFDPSRAAAATGTYRADIDGRLFDFALENGHFAAARRNPDATVTASAEDLVTARMGSTEAKRAAALRRITFDGDQSAVDTLCSVFRLDRPVTPALR